MNSRAMPLLALVLALGVIWAGCDSEPGFLQPNVAPNTRISSGPPESNDTGYQVEMFWFGFDTDGFVDHYEIAWETPEEWLGPIFSNDSLFAVAASGSCCVPALPEHLGTALQDSVFEQYHTFYVRAVDEEGLADVSPSFRTFNAKTLAPRTELTGGPGDLQQWGSDVTFKWLGTDPDGSVVRYRYALASFFDYARDQGDTSPNTGALLAWIDSITYYPLPTGGYDMDSLVWRETDLDTIKFNNVQATAGILGQPELNRNKVIFAVRAIDNAGAEEQVLTRGPNVVAFEVNRSLNGPCVRVLSNLAGSWNCFGSREPREVFAERGLRFNWSAVPGGSQTPVAGFSFAVDDTTDADAWSAFSLNTTEFPEQIPQQPEQLWFPDPGLHTIFIRAVDEAGFTNILDINLQVFAGPRLCPQEDRYILVVLDTDPGSIILTGAFPPTYEQLELGLMQYFFEGFDIQVHQTLGTEEPEVSLMNCASSTFWFVSGGASLTGDNAVLMSYHVTPPNVLQSYVAGGGNLFLAGIQPVNAVRFIETNAGRVNEIANLPIRFDQTLADTSLVNHWITEQMGIAFVEETLNFSDVTSGEPGNAFRLAKSEITSGLNPYPDLEFDPLSWPNGPQRRGFGYYDIGIIPLLDADSATTVEPIYTMNNTGRTVAIRKLQEPGPNGNLVYAGFHPYFLEKAPYREFLRAVLTDFGEVANP